ncbi:MAG TPA: M20 family metallopeptidase [Anaerolineales bacterium]|nr:M20 family metallopeptidase [Anaerolineales bacterium]
MDSESIAQHVESIKDKLIATRRDIHMYPELAGEEKRTSEIVEKRLTDLGLEVSTGIGGYGVVGILHGKQTDPVVAWRADMDAFQSENTLDVPYKSRVPGVKHVCGHDVHTAIGLGIAEVLANQRENISGTIKFIFQPAEENATGAHAMIQAGVLKNPRPDAIFGLHVAPLPTGIISSVSGMILPGMTMFSIDYEDSQVAQQELEVLTQKIMDSLTSLNILPMEMDAILSAIFTPGATLEPTVLVGGWPSVEESTGKIIGVQGLVRTTGNEEVRLKTKENIKNCLNEIQKESPVRFTFLWPETITLPATINDEHLEKTMRTSISRVIGQEKLLLANNPVPLNSEDFSMYLQHIPGVFYWLGVANESRGIAGMPHTPDFDVDEESILIGTNVMANLLLDYLAN